MTDDVAHLVLEDNRLQTLALSIMENDGAHGAAELCPRDRDVRERRAGSTARSRGWRGNDELLRRAQRGQRADPARTRGAARDRQARAAGRDRARATRRRTTSCSPISTPPSRARCSEQFATAIDEHRLRGEIVATKLANRIVNRLGVLHPFELAEEEGAAMGDIAAMFVVAERLFDLPALWARDRDRGDARGGAHRAVRRGRGRDARADRRPAARHRARRRARRRCSRGSSQGVDALDRADQGPAARGSAARRAARIAARAARRRARPPTLVAQGRAAVRDSTARSALPISAQRRGIDETVLTRAFTHLGQALGLDWAQAIAARITTERSVGAAADRRPRARFPAAAARIPRPQRGARTRRLRSRPGSADNAAAGRAVRRRVDRARARRRAECGDAGADRGPGAGAAGAVGARRRHAASCKRLGASAGRRSKADRRRGFAAAGAPARLRSYVSAPALSPRSSAFQPRARHHMMTPVTARIAGSSPPRKMISCQTNAHAGAVVDAAHQARDAALAPLAARSASVGDAVGIGDGHRLAPRDVDRPFGLQVGRPGDLAHVARRSALAPARPRSRAA